jgi:hypothetical protein
MSIFGEKIEMKEHEAAVAKAVADALAQYSMDGNTLTVEMYTEKVTELATVSSDLVAAQSALALKEEEVTALTDKVAELNKIPEGPSGKKKDGEAGLEAVPADIIATLDALPHNKKADALGYGA